MNFFQTEAQDFLKEALKDSPLFVLLRGDLGAGKTTFVQSAVKELGGNGAEVQSPTFLKLLEYRVPQHGLCVHIDAYRMSDASEMERLSLESYSEARVWFVEWPDLFLEFLRQNPTLQKHLGFEAYWELNLELKKVGPIRGPGGRGGEDLPTRERSARWSRKLFSKRN